MRNIDHSIEHKSKLQKAAACAKVTTSLRAAIALFCLLAVNGRAQAHDVCRHQYPPFEEIDAGETDGLVIADPVYSTQRNHWRRKLPGYEESKIILPAEIIRKLNAATQNLQQNLLRLFERRGMDHAQAIQEAAKYRIVVKDGYRPHIATDFMAEYAQEHEPSTSGHYVPRVGDISGHNNGYTVDVTIAYADNDGMIWEIWMGSIYDDFSPNAHHGRSGRELKAKDDSFSYGEKGFKQLAGIDTRELRDSLKKTMEQTGAKAMGAEWWHYSFSGSRGCFDIPSRPKRPTFDLRKYE